MDTENCGCKEHIVGPNPDGSSSQMYTYCEKHNPMGTEYASPVINNIPDGGGCQGNHSNGMEALAGILPIALLAPLLSGRGFGGRDGGDGGGRTLEGVVAEQVGNLRHDIGESTIQNLKESFHASETALAAAFEAKMEGMKAAFEAKLEGEKVINHVDNKINECCEETQKALCGLRGDMDKQFCRTDELIQAKFNRLELENKDEKIAALTRQITMQDTVTAILTAFGVASPIVGPLAKKA